MQLRSFLNRYPRLKAILRGLVRAIFPNRSVSSQYVQLQETETTAEATRLQSAWKSDELPAKQRKLVDRQLERFRAGEPVDVFDVFVQALRQMPTLSAQKTLLEIGCSSGFYSDVIQIAGIPIQYSGCDYSDAFIAMARATYPKISFEVQDATTLQYANGAFDVVVSGCCLLHIADYQAAVRQTARVTKNYAVFHRTPMVLGQATKYYKKQAYGVETVEIHFNEPEFLVLLRQCGLDVIATLTLDETVHDGVGSATRTYVCKKIDV